MWCLISQSNSVVFEVRVDPKSIGQDCLEKVRFFNIRINEIVVESKSFTFIKIFLILHVSCVMNE